MFTGTVQSTSHEGGLMVAFDGSSPSLNAIIVLSDDGTYVGKVDGVIGSTEHPLAHVAHIDRSLNLEDLMGRTVTIRPKKKREERGRDRQRSDRRSRDDGGRRTSRDDRHQERRQRYDRNGGDRRGGIEAVADRTPTKTTIGTAQRATIPTLHDAPCATGVKPPPGRWPRHPQPTTLQRPFIARWRPP